LFGSYSQTSSSPLTPLESQLVTSFTSTLVALQLFLSNISNLRSLSSLPFTPTLFAVFAGVSTQVGGIFYNRALSTGPTSAVAAIAGGYPAAVFLVNAVMGREEVNGMKVLGVTLAVASGAAFSMA
jgi:uncharacterized membrane protein